jgi:hypothetical protein
MDLDIDIAALDTQRPEKPKPVGPRPGEWSLLLPRGTKEEAIKRETELKSVGLIQVAHPERASEPFVLALTENGAVYRGRLVGSGASGDRCHLHWDLLGNVETKCRCDDRR